MDAEVSALKPVCGHSHFAGVVRWFDGGRAEWVCHCGLVIALSSRVDLGFKVDPAFLAAAERTGRECALAIERAFFDVLEGARAP